MPVIDTPVHEKTRAGSGHRYFCNNKPRTREPYLAPDGYVTVHDHKDHGTMVMVKMSWVEDTGTLDCRHDISLSDSGCEGCCHRGVGEAYWEEYRKRAS